MGNISSMARASTALDSYVAELGNDISYDKSLSTSRFMKTILARHAYGPLVLKIFIKPDMAMSLRPIQRRLKGERDALADLGNTNTYQCFVETEKAGYVIRQYVGANLYDRVSTQPYLASVEKKWIAFQLLTCLRDARTRKIGHGDIKAENVLITTDLSVLLTDFSSSFKPTFLPLDDPSDFSFFFDTSQRRTCYLAPERFYGPDSPHARQKRERSSTSNAETGASASASAGGDGGDKGPLGKRDGRVTEEMDVFSAGCVLAEMWSDGRGVFNLSELYAYKAGEVGLDGLLDTFDDENIKAMISQMLAREPNDRPSFDHVLSAFRGSVFPEYFYTFLKDYMMSLSEVQEANDLVGFLKKTASLPGTKIDRLLEEWDSVSIYLDKGVDENGPGLLLLNLVTSSMRNCIWPSSRLHALQLCLNLLPHLSDEDRVDRIVPYVVEFVSDESAAVRAEACRVLFEVVESVTTITPQNATYIPEYLLPQMRHLTTDTDVLVRATYARGLVRLADAAITMLEVSQAAKGSTDKAEAEAAGIVEPDYDSMLLEIQSVVEDQATILLVDPSSQVKRAFLHSIADLCLFFGRQKSNEIVLSHIMTYLNDRDWSLRLAFFDGIVGVGAFIGIRAVEEYVLPLMLQALGDPEEAVVARVIASLTSLASLGLLPRMRLWDIFFAVRGFLVHPNTWLRQGTAGFVAAAARNLPPSDVWCILYPSLRTLLHSDVAEVDEESILSSVITHISRATLVSAKVAALQNTPPSFWNIIPLRSTAKASLVRSANVSPPESTYLRDKGFSVKDEMKITAMKEFIVKQAHAAKARETSDVKVAETDLVAGKPVSLTDLGVTPQTVFISPRTVGVDARADLRRLRPLLGDQPSSRRTSIASRSARGTVDNPVDELRKRLATTSLETPSRTPDRAVSVEHSIPDPGQTPSESGFSSTLDLAGIGKAGRRKADSSKAAAAVGAIHTTALGTTSIHDDTNPVNSGRSTPTLFGRSGTPRTSAPYSSTYEGHDPGVRAFLEQVDLENYREPLLDFGPKILPSQRRGPRPKQSNNSQGVTIIGHLTQHTRAITSVITSPDHLFFATASEDGQVCIWDSARLERSVSTKPRLLYSMDAPITSMCKIENTHCLAVAAEDGQVHVLRVHVTAGSGSARYTKLECIRRWRAEPSDGHVKFISHVQESSLLLFTSTSIVARLDIRTMEVTARFQHPLEFGPITAVCPTTNWVVVGTSTGTISLWDLRFGLIVKSWRVGGRVTALDIHPNRGRGLWLMVPTIRAGGDEEVPLVKVYDIESSKLVETYQVRLTRPSSSRSATFPEEPEAVPDKATFVAELSNRTVTALDKVDEEPTPSVLSFVTGQSFASFVPGQESGGLSSVPEKSQSGSSGGPGWLVTAGEDRVVRYWDLAKISDSFVICGSQKEKDVAFRQSPSTASPALFYTLPNNHRQSLDRHAGVQSQRQPLRPHYDAISALSTIETGFSSCVISGDRSGIVKIWRMETPAKSGGSGLG